MATLGERIKAYREQLGLSQRELAEKCAELERDGSTWGQPRIANYEKDNRLPDLNGIKILAKVLGVSPDVLAFDRNVRQVKVVKTWKYPLLSKIQAGMWTGIDYFSTADEDFEMIPSNVMASEYSFYLRISGDSMLPRFKEGDLVLIDPTIAPTPGKFVAAINGDDEATFKQYKELGYRNEYGFPHFELVPLNPMFPTLSTVNQEIRVIGVAVEKRELL